MAVVPTAMRAVRFTSYGALDEVVQFKQDLPVPKPADDEILIAVRAAGVNPIDWKLLSGFFKDGLFPLSLPHVMGFDASGVVAAVGCAVTRFKIGDKVIADVSHENDGTFAEYAVCKEKYAAMKPVSMSFSEAAGIPLAGLTSYEALLDSNMGALVDGQKVLILNSGGGTGSIALQIAKAVGASWVAATCSQQKDALSRALGADETVDYRTQDWCEVLKNKGFDVIYDCAGAGDDGGYENAAKNGVVKKGGRFVTIANFTVPSVEKQQQLGVSHHLLAPRYCSGDHLSRLAAFADQGQLRVPIDSEFELEQTKDALKKSAEGHAQGKIVVVVSAKKCHATCYCGAVEMEVDVTEGPVFSGYCHCLSCRKAHAAPLYQTAVTKATTFKLLKGQDCLKSNPKETNFGSIDRRFCKECGSRICNLLTTKFESPLMKPGEPYVGVFPAMFDADTPFPVAWRPAVHVNFCEAIDPSAWRSFPPIKASLFPGAPGNVVLP